MAAEIEGSDPTRPSRREAYFPKMGRRERPNKPLELTLGCAARSSTPGR
jgi:hypothetical protein